MKDEIMKLPMFLKVPYLEEANKRRFYMKYIKYTDKQKEEIDQVQDEFKRNYVEYMSYDNKDHLDSLK